MLRRMNRMILVKIVGAPVACQDGVKEIWRELAEWAARQLQARYGDHVYVRYYDIFDPECPALPPDCTLPVVFVDDQLVVNNGKVSIPLIRDKIEGHSKP